MSNDYIEIDAVRIRKILDGKLPVETEEEKIALIAFERALEGELLLYTITDFPIHYDSLSEEAKGYFLVGYAFGQMDHQNLDPDRFNSGNSTSH